MCIDWVVQTTALNLLVHLGSFTVDERAWLKNSSFLGQISPGSSTGIHIPSTPIGDGHSTSHNPSKCVALFFCRGENPPFGLLHQLNLCLLRWAAIMVALRVRETRALRQQRLRGAQLGRTQSG